MRFVYDITSFYGSSCADNGKDALNSPDEAGRRAVLRPGRHADKGVGGGERASALGGEREVRLTK
eukprot:8104442-Pyramimonas_sp.AAC.1